jgi:endonuclease/exonuclease/phosphatase family metal-dependent hydrolase
MTKVRVLTWNIWGKNADWEAREDALPAALADVDADIVTVQEAWTELSGITQTARLAAALGFAHHHQADPPPPIRDRGLGVLTRWPITSHDTLALPSAASLTSAVSRCSSPLRLRRGTCRRSPPT